MYIEYLKFRNIRSYGNMWQEINFMPGGSHTLVIGPNGAGKSTILMALRFALYGKTDGKLEDLPNYHNGELEVVVRVKVRTGVLEITRGYAPTKLQVTLNGEPVTLQGKVKIQTHLNELLGMDYFTFSHFVTLHVKDFQGLLTLSKEEKRVLADRIFQLGYLEQLRTENAQHLRGVSRDYRDAQNKMEQLRRSIQQIDFQISQVEVQEDHAAVVERWEQARGEAEREVEATKSRLDKLLAISGAVSEKDAALRKTGQTLNTEQHLLKEEHRLLAQGMCPTCRQPLSSEHHLSARESLPQRMLDHKVAFETFNAQLTEFQVKQRRYQEDLTNSTQAHYEATRRLGHLESPPLPPKQTSPLLALRTTHEEELAAASLLAGELEALEADHRVLTEVFDVNGLRTQIIAQLVIPMSECANAWLSEINFKYHLTIDDQLNVSFFYRDQVVPADNLSAGERQWVNITLLLSYLLVLRQQGGSNLLFLDELYGNIDAEGTGTVARMIRRFAHEQQIHVLCVHHGLLPREVFDRVIEITPGIFSSLQIQDPTGKEIVDAALAVEDDIKRNQGPI